HCVAGTPGAEFHPALDTALIDKVVSKGTDRDREAYSAFDATDLADWLREKRVQRLLVAGLATDYCVRASVLDARRQDLEVLVLLWIAEAIQPLGYEVKPAPGGGRPELPEPSASW